MTSSPLIEVIDLVRRVPGLPRPLLEVERFAIEPGDRLGLRGASGSGKSSLLRVVAGLDPWETGELRFQSNAVSAEAMPGYRRAVVYLPQRAAVIAGTVEDNFRLPFELAISDGDYDADAVLELLAVLGVSATFLRRPADGLSGGERQLVALLRAVQLNPVVLLLDEPTASLDPESVARFEQAVAHWHHASDSGGVRRAYVITSHQAEQVARMSDRVETIDQGVLRERVDV